MELGLIILILLIWYVSIMWALLIHRTLPKDGFLRFSWMFSLILSAVFTIISILGI